jgi:hypothetical protein
MPRELVQPAIYKRECFLSAGKKKEVVRMPRDLVQPAIYKLECFLFADVCVYTRARACTHTHTHTHKHTHPHTHEEAHTGFLLVCYGFNRQQN